MDATMILRQDQVTRLYEDIKLEIGIKILDLVSNKKKQFEDKYKVWFESEIKPYNKLIKLNKEYIDCVKSLDKDIVNGKPSMYSIRSTVSYTPPEINESVVTERLTETFYDTHNLSKQKINTFILNIDKKIKAILCTLTNDAYENIVKVVHDKLNLDDLFDNRHKYLN